MALVVFVMTAHAARADISARINRVGLFAGANQMARDGVMTFVEVDLRNTGSAPFEGALRVTQTDRDGDIVVSELPVAVTPDGEWESKEVYFVPDFSTGNGVITVKLYDALGELAEFTNDLGETVRYIESQPVYAEPIADSLLIVNMSSGGRSPHASYLELRNQDIDFEEPITGRSIRGLAPRELPRKAQGLDAVDAIIWEDADPSDIQPEQAQALMDWVRQGGRLLLTVSSSWQSFDDTPLAEIIPLTFVGVDDVPSVPAIERIVGEKLVFDELESAYARNPVTRCRMRPRAGAIPIPTRLKNDDPIAYRAHVGRGMVTVVGARLNDLLPPPEVADFDGSDFAKKARHKFASVVETVVANNLLALPKPREAKLASWGMPGARRDLFAALTRTIGFSAVTTAFLFFAIAFACVYTFVATLGSFLFLRRKGWARHCWTAFSAVSIVGIVIGLGMVWALRGFSTKVWQTSVVDARAGENYGYATCLFGVKTKDHTRLDLRLPVGYRDSQTDDGPLFALPRLPSPDGMSELSFVAGDTYKLAKAGTALNSVPVRATLKEFEGRWHGELGGTLDARLVLDMKTRRFTTDSYLRNNLGITLEDCYLIEGDQDIVGEKGRTSARCHLVGRLSDSGTAAALEGAALVKQLYEKPKPKADGSPDFYTGIEQSLSRKIGDWRRKSVFGGLAQQNQPRPVVRTIDEHTPFLLLSVYNLIESGAGNYAWNLQRTFGRRLDCSHRITRQTAVLIGFSRALPPAIIEIDRAREKPEKSLTVYRFLIPVERR